MPEALDGFFLGLRKVGSQSRRGSPDANMLQQDVFDSGELTDGQGQELLPGSSRFPGCALFLSGTPLVLCIVARKDLLSWGA